jgi:hypothetical protein
MTTNAPIRRKDRREQQAGEAEFKPGRKGRQLACLVRPLRRTAGLFTNPVQAGDRDSEIAYIDYVWNHPKMIAFRAWLDSQEAAGAAKYKWTRSSLLFIAVASLLLRATLKEAYNRIRTDPELRDIGGFAPRPPRTERRAIYGAQAAVADPGFPTRQSVDDFINRWLGGAKKCAADAEDHAVKGQREPISERGKQALVLMEKLMQEIAFEAILRRDLDSTRHVLDGSIVPSGHKRLNAFRGDDGAKYFKKDDNERATFGRMHGAVMLVDAPFTIFADVHTPMGGEPDMAKNVLLPGAAEASRRFTEFAAQHGVEHRGFADAMMCGDAAFHNHPCIEATANYGFLAAYNVGGDKQEILTDKKGRASRELPEKGTGELFEVDLRDDGALLCRCKPSLKLGKREPMKRKVEKRFRTAYVHCNLCSKTYVTSPRSQDKITKRGREHGDIDLRYDITLPRWDHRVTAICFKARNQIEQMHGELMSMGLLPNGRGGDGWRSITGDFRHQFWYALGHLLWNIRVEYNLNQTNELQEYNWGEGVDGYRRNRHKLAQQDELGKTRAAIADQQEGPTGRKRRQKPTPSTGKHRPLPRKPLGTRHLAPLQPVLRARARARTSTRST